jgi:hypothetical protein
MTQVEPTPGLDADQIVVGTARGPGLWIAPLDAAMPADIDEDFGEGWVSLGYASEDGPTMASSTDSEDIRAWQALGVLRSIITGRTVTIQAQLMQFNVQNLALYWDIDMPEAQSDGTFAFPVRTDQAGQRHQIAIDVRDGDNEVRFIFPRCQLNAAGDLQFQRSAAALLDVTFAALEDAGRLVEIQGKVPSSGIEGASAAAVSGSSSGGAPPSGF